MPRRRQPRRTQTKAAIGNALGSVWWRITRLARLAFVLLFGGPILGVVFALFDQKELAALAMLTPSIGGLCLLWVALRDPRNIVALAPVVGLVGIAKNRKEIFLGILRWSGQYFAVMAAVSIFVFFVSVANDRWLVLPLIATALFVFILKTRGTLNWKTGLIPFLLGGTITAILIFGGREGVLRRYRGIAGQVIQAEYMPFKPGEAQPVIKGKVIEVAVPLHPGRWSEPILPAPYSWFFFEGPDGTPVSPDCRIRFASDTGEPQLCNQWFDIKAEHLNGFQFMGPEGVEVTVRIVARQ